MYRSNCVTLDSSALNLRSTFTLKLSSNQYTPFQTLVCQRLVKHSELLIGLDADDLVDQLDSDCSVTQISPWDGSHLFNDNISSAEEEEEGSDDDFDFDFDFDFM